jgi:hypothetical protein
MLFYQVPAKEQEEHESAIFLQDVQTTFLAQIIKNANTHDQLI